MEAEREKQRRKRPEMRSEDSFEMENPAKQPLSRSQTDASSSKDPSCTSMETSSCADLNEMRSNKSMFEPMTFNTEGKQRQEMEEPKSASVSPSDPGKTSNDHEDTEEDTSIEEEDKISAERKNFRKEMQNKFTMTYEGLGDQRSTLRGSYTELYNTTGGSGDPDPEHARRRVKQKVRRRTSSAVNLSQIFTPSPGQKRRVVLTKGVAGIGKSFAVQKFILDWAEEKENKHVDFVACLAFRELNLIRGPASLLKLLMDFHPVLLDIKDLERRTVIVILDGLDESRLQLNFESKPITSMTEEAPLCDLLANLIQGNLLPDAQVWITSRPAAADQIPAEFVDLVTEIQGFSEPQKQEYFMRRYSHNPKLAERIISEIQSTQSLDIMCQIPIFCWLTAILFQEILGEGERAIIPQTLTEMMAHLVFTQTVRRSRKYEENSEESQETSLKTHKEFLLKLGKLAFVQLQDNNLIFYDEDLEDCGIGVKEATVYSGFCNAVLREERVFSQRKIFFFVHLTIQEFFAALYVYDCFTNQKTEELTSFLHPKGQEKTLLNLLKMTVDRVLEEKNRHLDFFMQFLLGLVVEPNRRVLQGLLTPLEASQDTDKKMLTYLKAIRRKTLSPDSCISLFQTMVEMGDSKAKDEIKEYLRLSDRSKTELTPLHCSALAYMLQVSKNNLELLDLKSYNTTEEGRRRLIPAVRSCTKAILADCNVTSEWVEHLSFALKFPYSALRDLDLSNNDLGDSGVEKLNEGLSNQCCRLQTLRLSGCLLTELGCCFLASALHSNPSHLVELDVSYNNPGEGGKNQLSDLINDTKFRLSILSIDHDGGCRMRPGIKKYACELTLDPKTDVKNLIISEENRKVTWMDDTELPLSVRDGLDQQAQVLSEQSLDGRCYWEVEVFGPLSVGVKYKEDVKKLSRSDVQMGHDDNSWCLVCNDDDGDYALHNKERGDVAQSRWRSSWVGVYLDWLGGTLSFYRVSSESRTRLHTFKTKFKEPLYAAVELLPKSSACIVTI